MKTTGEKVSANKVVSIEYTLKDDEGEVLDSSEGKAPLAYIQGADNIVPGLEKALEGKVVGDALKVVVAPAEGYGERDENLVRNMPLRKFPDGKVKIGQRFHAHTEDGPASLFVTAIKGDYATVDANHPLAGATLHFDVRVVEIRDASKEEMEHGHVHGAGGHHH